ncbi:MAG TPA: alpha/beta hydrolase [Jatrophihabitans sp.]|nr:alpha/beta hydrolase [Jatrophihabitans sp.]
MNAVASEVEIVESRVVLGGIATRILEVDGAGPPILLLHGFSDSADSWRPLLRQLGTRARHAIAVDLPGSGYATRLGRPALASLDAFAAAFVTEFGEGGAILAGNSLGGLVALRAGRTELPLLAVAGLGPAGLEYGGRLLFVDTWGRALNPLVQILHRLPVPGIILRGGAQWLYWERLAQHSSERELARLYGSHIRGMRDVRRLWSDFLALGDDDRTDRLVPQEIKVPVLLIWGKHDPLAAVSGAQLLLDAVPGARLVVFDDCGHCPQLQRPADIAALLADLR